jgi:hypothetical protein
MLPLWQIVLVTIASYFVAWRPMMIISRQVWPFGIPVGQVGLNVRRQQRRLIVATLQNVAFGLEFPGAHLESRLELRRQPRRYGGRRVAAAGDKSVEKIAHAYTNAR